MTLSEIWKIIAESQLSTIITLIGIVSSVLVTTFYIGFRLAKFFQAHYLIDLKTHIAKLERENHDLKLSPKVALSLNASEEPINRITPFLRTSFNAEPFIHPKIIEQLSGWLSDSASDIVAIDISAAMKSNKYKDPVTTKILNNEKWVISKNVEDMMMFGYKYIGASPSGIQSLLTIENGGGTGTFYNVVFVVFQIDSFVDFSNISERRDRILIKGIGQVSLGDRYDGEISFKDGILIVGGRKEWFPEYFPETKVIILE
ncbi:MAG: hypothetical protein HZB61_15590 [Nitrospirae bacterium]|nr:hypothetical protein [Nitrospirota bacterium]